MIRVVATPDSVDVTPGVPVDLTITVSHVESATPRGAPRTSTARVSLRLVGLDPAWLDWAAEPDFTVDVGGTVTLPVTVTLPQGFPAGAQLIGIEATVEGVTRPALGSMQLVVASIEGVSVGLSPASFRGGRTGRFRINLINRGRDPITLRLTGRPAGDDEAKLAFKFKPDEVTLRPGERARSKASVSGKRPTIGAPRVRPMTVVAQTNSAPIHADARFTQRPLLSRKVLRVFAMFIAISMWAGALVTAVRFTQDTREETAADASAEFDPDADTDGDGVPDGEEDADGDGIPDGLEGEEGEEGEEVAPGEEGEEGLPGGPVISGQVTGLADRSGITVTGRYAPLAEAIPADATDDDVAAAGLKRGGSAKGKVFAAGVTVDTDDPARAERSTITDQNGFWTLAGVAEGSWELEFSKAGFTTRRLIVLVEKGVELAPLEVAMAAGSGSLAGTVNTADGPLGGAVITVTDGVVTFTTTTPTEGAVGTWTMSGLTTPATYLVTAERRGFGTETTSVTLGGSESKLDIAQTLVAGVGSISGTISGRGDGLGGILVTAASEAVTRSVTTLTDDPAGSFILPQLPIPGDYTLTVTGANWVPQTQLIRLTDNQAAVDFELLSTTATIVGEVEGPDGPLGAVGVTVAQDDPLVKTLTALDPVGEYEVSGLQPGTYTVTFERFGFETQSTIVELVEGSVKTVDVEMEATPESETAGDAVIQGIVRSGTTGDPIPGVTVAIQGKSVTSAVGGTFTLAALAAGTYDIVLTHAKHQSTARTVRIGVKAEITVDITMLPLGGLQGRVSDLTATPIAGVSVSVAAQTGTTAVSVPAVVTDANGEYSIIESFPTGSYVATFSKTGFGSQTREFEATAGSVSVADIQLVELGTITGAVQEPGGGVGGFLSLSNVTIRIYELDGSGNEIEPPVFEDTDVDGSYTVSGLDPGDYRVVATHADFGGGLEEFTRDLEDLKLREVRDGGIVMARGNAAVSGQVYFATGTGRQGVVGAAITAQVVTGYTILPTFPFVSPSLQSVTATSVDAGVLVDSDDDGAVDDVAPVKGFYVIDPQPVSGSIANYTVTATGFSQRIQAITSPTAGGSGDIVLIPDPEDITGTIALSDDAVGESVVVTLSSDVLSDPIVLAPNPTTGADGTVDFEFTDLTPGVYTITFTHDDYHTATDSVTIANGDVPIVNDAGTTELQKESSVEIVVRTNNGTGAFVSGASVTLTALSGSAFTQTKTSDVDGEALFTELTARTYRVSVSRTGFDTATSAATATATMIADVAVGVGVNLVGGTAPVATLQRHPDISIDVTGRLANIAPTGDTVTALLNANVSLTPVAGGAVINLVHSAGGTYTATFVRPDFYHLNITAPSHDPLVNEDITVSAGPNVDTDRELDKFGSIVVFLDKTIGGVTNDFTDADHTATPATITATPTAGGSTITLTKCAAVPVLPCPGVAGTWVANNVPAGTYAIVASASGFASAGIEIEDVEAGSTFTNSPTPVLALSKFASLTVNVVKDIAGTLTAIAATSVTATRTDGTVIPVTSTGTIGEYRVNSITPGTYNIAVQLTDHVTGTELGVVVGSGGSPTVEVELIELPDAAVTVEDGGGADITDATVLATPTGGGSPIAFTHDGGVPGTYRASKVPTGEYTLSVSAPGFATFTGVTGDFESTTLGTITGDTSVVLTIAASINVTVYDSVEDAGVTELDDATVVLRAVGGTNPTSRIRFSGDDGDGLAIFNEMTPTAGFTYSLTVTKAGYATFVQTGIVLGSGVSLQLPAVLQPLAVISFGITGTPGAAAVTNAVITATQSTTQITGVPLFNGAYVFPGLAAGDWTIAVAAPNHGTFPSATSFTLSALDSTTDVDVLPDGNVVAGVNKSYALSLTAWPTQTVTVEGDPGDAALSGALVTATPTSGSGDGYVLTETSTGGTYRSPPLSPLVAPGYRLSAALPGYTLDATINTGAVTAGVALNTVHNLRLLQNPTQSIEVKQVVDGAAAAAASGATVTATRVGGPTYTLTETAVPGTYVSPRLDPGGAYTITAAKSGFTLTLGPRTTDPVVAGATLDDMTTGGGEGLQLSAIPSLAVDVLGGFDDVGELPGTAPNPDAAGGDNATVTATSADGAHVVTLGRTGVGTYSTSALNAGVVYTIRGAKAGYTLDATASFTATAGAANGTRSLLLEQHPDVEVNAVAGLAAGLDDAAANDAVLTLTPQFGGSPIVLERDAVDGRFTYGALPPGAYTLRGSLDDHTSIAQTVTAIAGRVLDPVDDYELLLNPTLRVSLTSSAPAGDVNDAVVTATNIVTGEVIGLEFDATGDYEATLVPAGTYDILATGALNHGDGTGSVTVAPGVDNLGTSVTVPRFGTLTVTVNSSEDTNGFGTPLGVVLTPIDTASVTATNTVTGAVHALPVVSGAPAGDYAASLPPGAYAVAATAAGHDAGVGSGSPVTVSNSTSPTSTVDLLDWPDLVVDVDSIIDGVGGAALTSATVTATPTTGPVITIAEQGTTGIHSLLGATPGTYTITASKTGFATDDGGGATITLNAGERFSVVATPASHVLRDLGQHPTVTVEVTDGVGGVDVSEATVTLTNESTGQVFTLVEGAAGTYAASAVPPVAGGGYTLTVAKAGFGTFEDTAVTVAAGTNLAYDGIAGNDGAPEPDPVPLDSLPTVTVLVTNDVGGAVLSDVTVTLTRESTGNLIVLTEGVAGTYAASGVAPANDYTLTVAKDGFGTFEDDDVTVTSADLDYDFVAGGAVDPVALSPAAVLTVTVESVFTSGAGAPADAALDGATVVAVNGTTGDTFPVAQDPDGTVGNYRAGNLPPGAYTVQATAAGHAFRSIATTPATLDADNDGTATIELLSFPDLTVVVNAVEGGAAAAPLSGATVTATPQTGGGPSITLNETATNGQYKTLDLPPGATNIVYDIEATKAGYTTVTSVGAATAQAGAFIPSVTLANLVKAPTVTVTVNSVVTLGSTASSSDLTNATVTLVDNAAVPVLAEIPLVHQGDGVYTAPVTVPGTYDIEVEANGHTTKLDDNDGNFALDTGGGFEIASGDVNVARTVDLDAINATIAGDVEDIMNVDLPGVTVTAINGAVVRPAPPAAETTDNGGDYLIGDDTSAATLLATGLAPGVWSLTFDVDEKAPLTIVVTVPLGTAPDAGAEITGIDVTLIAAGGAVNGQVFEKASPLAASLGNPLSGLADVVVTIKDNTGATNIRAPFTTTAATGYWFGFEGIADGTYDITVVGPAGYDGDSVTAGVQLTVTYDNVAIGGGAIVNRTTVFDAPLDDVAIHVDLLGAGNVEGADFLLTNPALDADGVAMTGTTALNGNGTFEDVPYGTWTLTVTTTPPGYANAEDVERTIVVAKGGGTSIDHSFSGLGTISGTVLTNDDAAFSALPANYDDGGATGAIATLTHANGYRQEATVAADGTYSLTNVPAVDNYVLTFTHPDYTTEVDADTDLSPNEIETVDAFMDKLASFVVEIVDQDGTPLPGATLQLFRDVAATQLVADHLGNEVAVGTGSSFTIAGLDPSNADVSIHARAALTGYMQQVDSTKTFVAGDNGGMTVTLVANATVNATVNGLTDDTATLTLSWTTPLGGADDFSPPAYTSAITGPVAITVPGDVEITADIVETGNAACLIDAGGDIDVSPFTPAAGSSSTLTYTCTDA